MSRTRKGGKRGCPGCEQCWPRMAAYTEYKAASKADFQREVKEILEEPDFDACTPDNPCKICIEAMYDV